jgi:hypothetical protein
MSQTLATFEFNQHQLFIILEGLRKLKAEQKECSKWAEMEHYEELKEAYLQTQKEIFELQLVLESSRKKMLRDQLKIAKS